MIISVKIMKHLMQIPMELSRLQFKVSSSETDVILEISRKIYLGIK